MDIEGIVLRVVPYKEKDAIVTVLTPTGFQSFLARGILKIDSKNAFLINLYTKAIFDVQEAKNGHFSLKNGNIIKSPTFLMSELSYLLAIDAIGELILKFCDDNTSAKLYPYLDSGLFYLEKKSLDPLVFISLIAANCLQCNGYQMKVDSCVVCDKQKDIVSFDFESGGLICIDHFDYTKHINQKASYLKAVRQLFLVPSDKIDLLDISPIDSNYILHNLNDFIVNNTGVYLKGIEQFLKVNK